MARDPAIDTPDIRETGSAEAGKPDEVDIRLQTPVGDNEYGDLDGVDTAYWIACMEDAERAELNWRSRAREIVQIYRNEGAAGKKGRAGDGPVYFNVLFANTEVMLPAIFAKPPQPVVRSRFTKVTQPMVPPPGLIPPGAMPPPGMPPVGMLGAPPPPGVADPAAAGGL